MHYYGELGSSLRDIDDIFSGSLRLLQMIDGEGSFLFPLVLTIIMAILKYFNGCRVYFLSSKLL